VVLLHLLSSGCRKDITDYTSVSVPLANALINRKFSFGLLCGRIDGETSLSLRRKNMAISVVTLNIEGDQHFDRFVPVINRINPEVICFQEIFAADLPGLAIQLGFSLGQYEFLPMTSIDEPNPYSISPRGPWGVALFSHLDHEEYSHHYYKGVGNIPKFSTPNSVDRGILMGKFYSRSGQLMSIGTTHFTWTGDGESSEEQARDFAELKKQVADFPSHVLCGDFNSARGKETFSQFESIYIDGLPKNITTTIDGSLHHAGALELVVDTVFYQEPYDIEVLGMLEGVSDHKGISFLVHSA